MATDHLEHTDDGYYDLATVEGIRLALKREDITNEDRKKFEEALEQLQPRLIPDRRHDL
ncbi:MAG: hypothetical protein JO199_09185 [Candidatus Eremiobacteraeota bacterium]|nr:hypothetical protein [Candidatus Eremiobacteraeota bacterium]